MNAIHREDATVAQAVGRELAPISRAVDVIAKAFARGGRMIYVGAGTSGRLATLDAAECPPTFGVSPLLVQAVIAGGRRALTGAVEGAEDSAAAAQRDLKAKRLTSRDVVVGITASGSTPYVLGGLEFARKQGAETIGITANRRSPIAKLARILIAPDTGPEVIAGSTRMKAGTGQKLVLNLLSTAAMIRAGHVYDNWMVDVALTNEKLRQRGRRILEEAAGVSSEEAALALAESKNNLRVALVMLKTGVAAPNAQRMLTRARGNLRQALKE